jgi:hypothetical protein
MTEKTIIEYAFPWPTAEKGYRLFPEGLENDELVAFHGTAQACLRPIIKHGFSFAGSLSSLSFAKDSSLALSYACSKRSDESREGCVIAVRFAPPVPRRGIQVEVSTIHVFTLDEQPEVIGYCKVPENYAFL